MKETFLYLVGALLAFAAILTVLSLVSRFNSAKRKLGEKYEVVQVRVSKENELGPIVAESIFATLHGIQKKFTFWERLQGYSSDHVSFEIASIERSIKFYVAFPEKLRNLVEGQIYA